MTMTTLSERIATKTAQANRGVEEVRLIRLAIDGLSDELYGVKRELQESDNTRLLDCINTNLADITFTLGKLCDIIAQQKEGN